MRRICSALRKDPVVLELIDKSFPFVLALRSIDTRPLDKPIDCVVVDNERGGDIAMEHLVRIGHQKIGILAGGQDTSTGHHRLVDALAALEGYGIKKQPDLILKGDFKRKTRNLLTQKLLKKPNRPTAIFAHNDHMVIGALHALREKRLSVPQDMALIGFDDIEMTGVAGLDLTTVSQKKSIMGRMAVDALIDRIKGETEHITKRITLDPILIIRKSCGFVLAGRKYQSKIESNGLSDLNQETHNMKEGV